LECLLLGQLSDDVATHKGPQDFDGNKHFVDSAAETVDGGEAVLGPGDGARSERRAPRRQAGHPGMVMDHVPHPVGEGAEVGSPATFQGRRRAVFAFGVVDHEVIELIFALDVAVRRTAFGFTSFRNYRVRSLLYAGKPNWTLLATVTPR
jgi:hypothetical protein